MEIQTEFLAATLIFFVFGLIAAGGLNPPSAILAFSISLGSYMALEKTPNPEDSVKIDSSDTAVERLSKLTKQTEDEIHEAHQVLIDKGLIYPSDNVKYLI